MRQAFIECDVGSKSAKERKKLMARFEAPILMLVGWRATLLGWRRSLLGWRLEAIALRLEAIAPRVEPIANRMEAISLRLEAIANRLEDEDPSVDSWHATLGLWSGQATR